MQFFPIVCRLCLGSAAGVEIASFRSHADLQIPRFHFESSLASLECDAFCQQHSYVEFQRKGQLWLQSFSASVSFHSKFHGRQISRRSSTESAGTMWNHTENEVQCIGFQGRLFDEAETVSHLVRGVVDF